MTTNSRFAALLSCIAFMITASNSCPGEGSEQILEKESLGGLKVGSPAKQVLALLGEPAKRSKMKMQEATGDYIEDWDFPKKGLELSMTPGPKRPARKE